MGRYRGGRGGGSGALIQIVVYLVIRIIEAIIRAVANRSKAPKVKTRKHYKDYDDRDYDRDKGEKTYKKRHKYDYAREQAVEPAAKAEPVGDTTLLIEKPRSWPVIMLRILGYLFGTMLVVDTLSLQPEETMKEGVTNFLVAIFTMMFASGVMLWFLGLLYTIFGYKRFKNFAKAHNKNMFTYFLDKGVFIGDLHYWLISSTIALSFAYFGARELHPMSYGALAILVPIYLIVSSRHHMYMTPAMQITAPQEPAAAPVMDTGVELRRICEHLEDEALVGNVQEIIKYSKHIEQALVKYPNAKKGELVQEYNAQLLNFLNLYNEAEDLRLTGKASLSMMENTRTYAADLVQMMRNVLEQIYEANVETADVNIEVMRRDMRMRGLVDEEK